jgi:dTDP-4-amino-4,6-dideoxygalactose transaminase
MALSATRIPIAKTLFGAEELRAIQRPLESGWVVQGPYVAEFEQKFSAFTSARHAIATSNCTTALHIAVAALGLKPGDEVIVPSFTWVSTANVVEYMGARPVFCDIDLATYNIDAAKIEPLITSRTVGVIPVHLFGLAADMAPILELARRRGLWVVEDAACALGARYHGTHAGTLADAGCFSFHPRKSITTGEGGMITTARDDIADAARSLRDHGASRSDHARHHSSSAFLLADYDLLGFNYRLTDIQGALGSVQMDRAAAILERRRAIAGAYDESLAALPWLGRPLVPPGYVHGYQAYVTLFRPEPPTMTTVGALHERRNRLMAALEEHGVATRQGTHAPVNTGFYARKYGLRPDDYPNATLAEKLTLALPLYPQLTDDDQAFVVSQLAGQFARL